MLDHRVKVNPAPSLHLEILKKHGDEEFSVRITIGRSLVFLAVMGLLMWARVDLRSASALLETILGIFQ